MVSNNLKKRKMKIFKNNMLPAIILLLVAITQSGCEKMFGLNRQKDYDYEKKTLDPNIGVSARKFLEDRATGTGMANGVNDTVFKYMKLGLEYAGIDLSEYEKGDRTFLFLHNDAIRVLPNKNPNIPTAGLWFDFPIVTGINPTTGLPITKPATQWSDYPKEDVRNYFLYLIGQGKHNFDNLNATNKTVKSFLPTGAILSKSSMLGYANEGKGFDEGGNFYLRLLNNSDLAPIVHNNRTNDRSAGYVATNGIIHVFGASLAPALSVTP
ncbi:hypothetical protein SAMN04489864_102383 [Pedobacter insulae]|uniref:Uncharacterized protein n=2 Tax=Pedobacter insulae TaxID=414048 RepID=A0A1I2UWS2_9SPHI|nr:hypothetical protein SAMN04489864_102383 [Pedobacter insulae]